MSKIKEYFENKIEDTVSIDAEALVNDVITYALTDCSDEYKATNIKAFVMNCDDIKSQPLEKILFETSTDYNPAKDLLKGYEKFNSVKSKLTNTYDIATEISELIDNVGELQRLKSSGKMGTEKYNKELISSFDKILSLAQRAPLADLYKAQLELGQAILNDGADIIQNHIIDIENADALRAAIESQNWELVDRMLGYDELQESQQAILAYKQWCDSVSGMFGISNPYYDKDFQSELAENQRQYAEYMDMYTKARSGIPVDDIIDDIVDDTASDANSKTNGASNTKYDPIILDLDGDGFNIDKKEDGVHFDLDKNGFAEKVNWTSKDGFLCLDLNDNGVVDNGGENFYVNFHLT